jgi:hypothetical protein
MRKRRRRCKVSREKRSSYKQERKHHEEQKLAERGETK